jgi:zinc protease
VRTRLGGIALPGILAFVSASAQAALPIEQWQTDAGARVLFVEARNLSMLDVSVDFPAGASRDTPEKSGAAALTLQVMRLGAGGLGEDEISGQLADVGAQLSSRFDSDRGGYAVRTLSSAREREAAVAILELVLQKPTFSPDVLERERARVLAGLRESDSKPQTIADREFRRLIYGDHPYAQRGSGEADTVARITRADLQAFYRRHYVADEAVVSIIGDLSRDEARAMAARLTAGLPRSGQPLATLPPVPQLADGHTSRLPHPATQAHIVIGQPGIKRMDPDYFPLWLGNHVLGGGGFSSRLNEEIRQKRGFAYSAYSYFNPLSREGPFQIGLQTSKEQAEEALKVARETLAKYVAEGPSEQELAAAKQNIVGGFALRIDSNKKIHEYLAVIGFYRLPLTYLEDFPVRIEAVTLAEIKDAWRRRIHPERMVTVVVGSAGMP